MGGYATLVVGEAHRALRSGGRLNGQVFSANGQVEPRRRYDGDELWSLEAGGKISLLDGRRTPSLRRPDGAL
jgi:hypothetical protein